MMAQRNDEPIKPVMRNSRSQNFTPISYAGTPPVAVQSPLRSGLSTLGPADIAPELSHPSPGSGNLPRASANEAPDYLNSGLPHDFGETVASTSSSPRAHSLFKPAHASSNNLAYEADPVAVASPSTPPGRRSVQFARTDVADGAGHTRQDSWDVEDAETPGRDKRGPSLMSKLKALASASSSQMHNRSHSTGANSIDEPLPLSIPLSPNAERSFARVPHTLQEEGSDIDADAEETADEGAAAAASTAKFKRKRPSRRPHHGGSQTAPSTPKTRVGGMTHSPAGSSRPNIFRRRSTMPDSAEEQQRGGLSEGEGRDRLGKESAWRRGSSWIAGGRGPSFAGHHTTDDLGTPSGRRPSNFRRITGMGVGSDGDGRPKRPFLGGERGATFGAQKWRALKHGLKLLGQKKEENKVDFLKSAELMAELRAGAPAALMLASMIQRDEHGNKRIPVLLEQLKLRVTDSKSLEEKSEGERHLVFRIELEYGSGMNRMKWVVDRSLKDFANLHLRYKLQGSSDKYIQLKADDSRPKQPRFPRSAFPYMRGVRGLGDSEDEDGNLRGEETANEGVYSEAERHTRRKPHRRPSLSSTRMRSSVIGNDAGVIIAPGGQSGGAAAGASAKKAYNERQRRKLEQYLQEMIRWLIFRADSNRLCKFLELSALGVRLAAEGSYHGKEGYLMIQSSKGIDFRRMLTPKNVVARHSPKWFLVRHSYMVCVDSPENMHIYDVFLVDPKFQLREKQRKLHKTGPKAVASKAKSSAAPAKHHSLKLQNSERRLKLLAKNERQLKQFEDSLRYMMENSRWAKPNRFDSFAPVRTGVYAQWLVDGRDYMWNVSRAINMAKDVIYIHDWWLSPQLYMRRPAAISQKWRLDRLLRKKAREGVKIFIIIYRNVEAAIPIDSEYTKFSMLDLHPNVFVQRSPNQFKKNQFFFAHHEKICIVDHTVAFVGGIDLCFGRWDTPQHTVCDDKPTGFEETDQPKDADHCQLWPGKDYSNPRVQDFYNLSEPYAEMYDRNKTPRMPWHDISMQVVGQPARDLTRHFVQRWNYVLRGRKPTRPTPFLLPPPDYVPADLEALGLNGTCEVQILRSASNWSLGIQETEHSIMNAYCKMIEESEHFVYIENQFFITSCETMNVKIINKIGDAIVERALRASNNNEAWRCTIVIPLMPGFQNTVDEQEGTSVRLIMQCQFRSICRGDESIFGRLKSEGVEPEDFIQFYSLRSWGKIGPNKMLVTEQLYIHAKVIIVDDRIALIGSANINERSMLGIRDSECAAVVRDTDMLWSTMDGKPYLVGRFAHTLRMRLMREHLGLDVDEVMEEERRVELDREEADYENTMNQIYGDDSDEEAGAAATEPETGTQQSSVETRIAGQKHLRSFNHNIDWELGDNPNLKSDKLRVTSDKRVTGNKTHAAEVDGDGVDKWKVAEESGIVRGRDSVLVDGVREVLIADIASEGKGTVDHPQKVHKRASPARPNEDVEESPGNFHVPPPPRLPRMTTEQLGLPQLSQLPALPVIDDTDIGGPPLQFDAAGKANIDSNPLFADIKPARVDKDCMKDPLNDSFYEDTWRLIAENNTKIFRKVFRCNPDSEVTTWHEYREFMAYGERFSQAQTGAKSQPRQEQERPGKSGPPGATLVPGVGAAGHGLSVLTEKVTGHQSGAAHPMGTVQEWANKAKDKHDVRPESAPDEKAAAEGRVSNEGPSPVQPSGDQQFPSLDASAMTDGEQLSEKPAARRATFTPTPEKAANGSANGPLNQGSTRRRRRGTTRGSRKGFSAADDLLSYQDAEQLLGMVQGHLVLFPYDWLIKEEHGGNWLYQVDQVAPLQI